MQTRGSIFLLVFILLTNQSTLCQERVRDLFYDEVKVKSPRIIPYDSIYSDLLNYALIDSVKNGILFWKYHLLMTDQQETEGKIYIEVDRNILGVDSMPKKIGEFSPMYFYSYVGVKDTSKFYKVLLKARYYLSLSTVYTNDSLVVTNVQLKQMEPANRTCRVPHSYSSPYKSIYVPFQLDRSKGIWVFSDK